MSAAGCLAPALKRLCLMLAMLASVTSASIADDSQAPPPLPKGLSLPVMVHLSSRILNVSRIEETKGEMSAQVEYTQNWNDSSQAFDPRVEGTYRQDFYGVEATGKLASVWSPGLAISNQMSEPRLQSVALSIASDGAITLVRQVEADFRIGVNLAAFPFDRQNLPLVFTTPRHPASEVVFAIADRDRELSALSGQLSAPDWQPDGLSFALSQFYGWNAKPYSEATITASVSRSWPRYLLRIFIPFLAIISVSLFILWAPEKVKVDHAGITYSALLALAALSFTFEASFPGSMSVNSPIAFMISIGYFYLVLTLLVHLVLTHGNVPFRKTYPMLADEISANIRYTLPGIFALICICSVVRSLT